ncbi:hypothetical protein OSTOST_06148 [Ostertagia ostertagi]
MGSTAQESAEDTEEGESDSSGSSIWASDSHREHSARSGEEEDIDSCTNEGTISPASSGFEIGSPVIVDVPYSSEGRRGAEHFFNEEIPFQQHHTSVNSAGKNPEGEAGWVSSQRFRVLNDPSCDHPAPLRKSLWRFTKTIVEDVTKRGL